VPESLTFGGELLWQESSANVALKIEEDLDGRVHAIEELGDVDTNLYRGTKRENRGYTAILDLIAGGAYTLDELKAWWRLTHSAHGGLRTVQRVTASGATCYLDAVPERPNFAKSNNPVETEVTQAYTAPTPLWYTAEVNASENFDGANPVLLACNNLGDVPAWIRLEIDGAVEDPKIAYGTEWELEFNLELLAGDTLAIICKTSASVWYTPIATGIPERAYGRKTDATMFRLAKIPTGNNNLTLTATAGAGLCTVYWSPLYEALQ